MTAAQGRLQDRAELSTAIDMYREMEMIFLWSMRIAEVWSGQIAYK
ncbi:MAG: hypothetical protein O7G88_21675 [bacterium]|nr:hypothetical protein [bacterium]